MRIMIEVVRKLHEEQGIIHGDIKPGNMLLCSDGKVRFCDFAGAVLISDPNPSHALDSILHMSPYCARHEEDPSTIQGNLLHSASAYGKSSREGCLSKN